MKAFQRKLSDPLPELHDQYIFEEREARRDRQDAEWESRQEYEADQRAGNPPEYDE